MEGGAILRRRPRKPAPQGMMQAEALPAGAGAVLVELASSSGHAHWNGDTLLRAALDL